jgi:hypothetical protein
MSNVNVVYVDEAADFPAAIGGVINLVANTRYIGDNHASTITLTDDVKFGENTRLEYMTISTSGEFIGDEDFEFQHCIVWYSGTGTLLDFPTLTSISFMYNSTFYLTSTGTLFNLNSVAANTVVICNIVGWVSTAGTASLGVISDATVSMDTVRSIGFGGGGLSFEDNDTITLSKYLSTATGSGITHLTFNGTTQDDIQISRFSPEVTGSDFAFDFDTSTSFDGVVTVTSCTINDASKVYAATSYDDETVGFKFIGNANVADSTSHVDLTALDEAGTQTLLDQNKVKRIVATYSTPDAERFSITAAGNAEYIGLENTSLMVNATMTGTVSSGTNINFDFFIVQGDSNNTIASVADAGGGVLTVTTSAAHGYSNSDVVVQEGTTSYNDSYVIADVTSTTYNITETWVATETGTHGVVLQLSKSSNTFSGTNKNTSLITLLHSIPTNTWFYLACVNLDTVAEWETEDVHLIFTK